MGNVDITRTTALFPSAVFLQWDITTSEPGDHLVDVYRAGAPTGPWQQLASSLVNAYHFLDAKFNLPGASNPALPHEGLNLFALSREVYYQVAVTPPSGSANRFLSIPTLVEPGLDTRTRLFKRKILRDEATAFQRLNGVPLIVLKRRHWGTLCTRCYDPVTHESVLEHCPQCFGTTFDGGYWAPVSVRGRKTPAPVQTQITAHGESDTKVVNFIVLDYPHIEYKDVVVDLRHNDRYEVQMVTPTELRGVTVHQTLTASLLARNCVQYAVPVDPVTTPPLY